jgi:hypothetical protein
MAFPFFPSSGVATRLRFETEFFSSHAIAHGTN